MAAPDQIDTSPRRTIEIIVLIVVAALFLFVSLQADVPANAGTEWWFSRVGILLAAALTLIMYSFLYRDNPLFKAAENLYVGVALGYGVILTWRLSLKPEIVDPLFVDPPHMTAFLRELAYRIVPIILGLLLMTRLSRRYGWLSRYAYTLMVGWGAGIGIPIVVHSYILQQVQPALSPLTAAIDPVRAAGVGLFTPPWFQVVALPVIGSLAILVGTVAVLFYFFFSVEHKGVGGAVSRVGIWFLMVSFGASFGYTVMGRVSLLIGRVQFLLYEWAKIGQ